MIVQPDFADHWKTELLVRVCGSETAVRCLLRFWSHCQNRKKWSFEDMTPELLAAICRWPGDAAIFWSAMTQTFIDVKGKTATAHEWEEANARLVHNWTVGKSGGRPPKEPLGCVEETQGLSQGITQGQTLGVTDRGIDGLDGNDGGKAPPPQVSDVLNAWNSLGPPFPSCRMTDERRKSLRARLGDPFFLENWETALDRIKVSSFCRGVNDRSWIADIDFFLRPGSVTKTLEGKYDQKFSPATNGHRSKSNPNDPNHKPY